MGVKLPGRGVELLGRSQSRAEEASTEQASGGRRVAARGSIIHCADNPHGVGAGGVSSLHCKGDSHSRPNPSRCSVSSIPFSIDGHLLPSLSHRIQPMLNVTVNALVALFMQGCPVTSQVRSCLQMPCDMNRVMTSSLQGGRLRHRAM